MSSCSAGLRSLLRVIRTRQIIIFISLTILLTGCSSLPGRLPSDELTTATPLPESSTDDGLAVQPPDACLVGEDNVVQSNNPLGDMLAWQPGEAKLAFVAPVGRSWGWGVGDAVIASLSSRESISTSNVRVAGDLTWSPDGTWLAFLALRASDDQYTVMVWQPSDGSLIDLFSQGAASSEFSGYKGIVRWFGKNRLQISESCGVDCRQLIEVSILGVEQRIAQQIRQGEDTSLELALNHPDGFALFEDWVNPNISPDGRSVFFSDENDTAWIGYIEEGVKYPLALNNGTPLESKWSDDSRYLAVRTEQQVLVFKLHCQGNSEWRKLTSLD